MTTKEASQRLAAATEVMSEIPGVIFISGEITDKTFKKVAERIIKTNLDKSANEIWLVINSEGGSLTAATGLVNIMEHSAIPVNTVGFGDVASAAFMIFVAGKFRVLSAYAVAFSHQYNWTVGGSHNDLVAVRKGEDEFNRIIQDIIKKYTHLTTDALADNLNLAEGIYLNAEECLGLGICDSINLDDFKIEIPKPRRRKA